MSAGNKQPEAMRPAPGLVLASGSSIRRTILENAGIPFRVRAASSDEPDPIAGEDAEAYVLRAAEAKARAALGEHPDIGSDLVIGCDQVVRFEGRILRKVATPEAAVERLAQLATGPHELVNGLVILRRESIADRVALRTSSIVRLRLRPLPRPVLERYIALERPLSSVACYFLEGAGMTLIEELAGDWFSALGLPLRPVVSTLLEHGWQPFPGSDREPAP